MARSLIRLLPPARRLEWYPPFRAMGIRVVSLSDDWQDISLRLPLSRFNRNPGGGMFGGAMASLADPIPALMCGAIFPDYSVWTRAMSIDFHTEARTDLLLRVVMENEQLERIRLDLGRQARSNPSFEYHFVDEHDNDCARVSNTVAIRPKGYLTGNGALGGRGHHRRG